MKNQFVSCVLFFFISHSMAQDPATSGWHIQAGSIDPKNYYGVTVANGMFMWLNTLRILLTRPR